eukprot:11162833-Heterocapsa_arctica.AAC.1
MAELRGFPMTGETAQDGIESIPCTVVADAKDTHDKVTSDSSAFGARRSMAFTVPWLKQQFRGRSIACRRTATENML